jgi:hypothetical protein
VLVLHRPATVDLVIQGYADVEIKARRPRWFEPIAGSACPVASEDQPTDAEREALSLARGLAADVDAGPLITSLADGHDGPERVRDALTLLAELDPDLIVQVALDALIQAHLHDPATARQTRRIVRGPT